MIKGNNRLTICHATMKAVLQSWLDNELSSPVVVEEIAADDRDHMFVIRLSEPQDTPAHGGTLERSAHTPPEQGLGPDEAETRSDTGQ